MPQVTNWKLLRDKNSSPIGKGTLHDSLMNISALTSQRAMKMNLLEMERLQRINRIYDKNKRRNDVIMSRVMERTEKSLKNMQAFRHVLNNDYCVDNFKTMSLGFKRNMVQTPRTARRFKLETRVYHSGYDMKAFQPEINRRLRQTDPTRVTRIFKNVLLEKFQEESNIVIDRKLSSSGFHRMLNDKDNLKKYGYQRMKSTVRFKDEEEEEIKESDETKKNSDDIVDDVELHNKGEI